MQSFMTLTGIDATSTNRTGFWIRLSKLCHKSGLAFFFLFPFLINIHFKKSSKQKMFHSENFQA